MAVSPSDDDLKKHPKLKHFFKVDSSPAKRVKSCISYLSSCSEPERRFFHENQFSSIYKLVLDALHHHDQSLKRQGTRTLLLGEVSQDSAVEGAIAALRLLTEMLWDIRTKVWRGWQLKSMETTILTRLLDYSSNSRIRLAGLNMLLVLLDIQGVKQPRVDQPASSSPLSVVEALRKDLPTLVTMFHASPNFSSFVVEPMSNARELRDYFGQRKIESAERYSFASADHAQTPQETHDFLSEILNFITLKSRARFSFWWELLGTTLLPDLYRENYPGAQGFRQAPESVQLRMVKWLEDVLHHEERRQAVSEDTQTFSVVMEVFRQAFQLPVVHEEPRRVILEFYSMWSCGENIPLCVKQDFSHYFLLFLDHPNPVLLFDKEPNAQLRELRLSNAGKVISFYRLMAHEPYRPLAPRVWERLLVTMSGAASYILQSGDLENPSVVRKLVKPLLAALFECHLLSGMKNLRLWQDIQEKVVQWGNWPPFVQLWRRLVAQLTTNLLDAMARDPRAQVDDSSALPPLTREPLRGLAQLSDHLTNISLESLPLPQFDDAFRRWDLLLQVIGPPKYILDPAVRLEALRGYIDVFNQLLGALNARKPTKKEAIMAKAKGKPFKPVPVRHVLPEINTMLRIFGPVLFDLAERVSYPLLRPSSSLQPPTEPSSLGHAPTAATRATSSSSPEPESAFVVGRAEAFAALSRLFCERCAGDIDRIYVSKFYSLIHRGLASSENRTVRWRILESSTALFQQGLPGFNILICDYIVAICELLNDHDVANGHGTRAAAAGTTAGLSVDGRIAAAAAAAGVATTGSGGSYSPSSWASGSAPARAADSGGGRADHAPASSSSGGSSRAVAGPAAVVEAPCSAPAELRRAGLSCLFSMISMGNLFKSAPMTPWPGLQARSGLAELPAQYSDLLPILVRVFVSRVRYDDDPEVQRRALWGLCVILHDELSAGKRHEVLQLCVDTVAKVVSGRKVEQVVDTALEVLRTFATRAAELFALVGEPGHPNYVQRILSRLQSSGLGLVESLQRSWHDLESKCRTAAAIIYCLLEWVMVLPPALLAQPNVLKLIFELLHVSLKLPEVLKKRPSAPPVVSGGGGNGSGAHSSGGGNGSGGSGLGPGSAGAGDHHGKRDARDTSLPPIESVAEAAEIALVHFANRVHFFPSPAGPEQVSSFISEDTDPTSGKGGADEEERRIHLVLEHRGLLTAIERQHPSNCNRATTRLIIRDMTGKYVWDFDSTGFRDLFPQTTRSPGELPQSAAPPSAPAASEAPPVPTSSAAAAIWGVDVSPPAVIMKDSVDDGALVAEPQQQRREPAAAADDPPRIPSDDLPYRATAAYEFRPRLDHKAPRDPLEQLLRFIRSSFQPTVLLSDKASVAGADTAAAAAAAAAGGATAVLSTAEASPPVDEWSSWQRTLVDQIDTQGAEERETFSRFVDQLQTERFADSQAQRSLLPPRVTNVDSARMLLAHFGFLSKLPRAETDLRMMEHSAKLSRSLKLLDANPSRECHKIGVIYVAPGQDDQRQILRNDSGHEDYEAFVDQLGWAIDTTKHRGFLGGLDPRTTGQFAPYFATSTIEMVFHVVSRMPTKWSDVQQIHKKRHVGNDHVNVVWVEHLRDYVPGTITAEFNDVHIIIYPMRSLQLYRIHIHTKPGIPPFGPLQDGMMVPRSQLATLVRLTALNANRAKRYSTPGYNRPYPTRRKYINEIVERYSLNMKPVDLMSAFFPALPLPTAGQLQRAASDGPASAGGRADGGDDR